MAVSKQLRVFTSDSLAEVELALEKRSGNETLVLEVVETDNEPETVDAVLDVLARTLKENPLVNRRFV